jgi:hypothetical protein
MEYLNGATLKYLIAAHTLDTKGIVGIAIDADALEAAHAGAGSLTQENYSHLSQVTVPKPADT